jgi:nicotinamidase-related amidase
MIMKRSSLALALSLSSALALAAPPQTLFEMAGVHPTPGRLSDSVLVIIDAQREYRDGSLPLTGIEAALTEDAKLLARARAAGTPVVHIVHRGGGNLFNPQGAFFEVLPPLAPKDGETVVEKRLPNAFAGTDLEQVLAASHRKHLIVVGFMTHMCVSATVRAALDHGYATTVVASATATRDLPDGKGGKVAAAEIQRASLAELADRFADVVASQDVIAE